jgi:hypothetical protein
MNSSRHPSRDFGVVLTLLCLAKGWMACAQDTLPEPARLFSAKSALALYLDLERPSQSGIWKALENRLGPLEEQLRALPQLQPQLSGPLPEMPDFETGDVAEVAIAIEGKNAFENMESERYDPDFSVAAAVRFRQTIDQQKLVAQLLDEAEKQQPGLRAKLEESRQRLGAVDWFELPPEALEEAKLPFALGLAIGPGNNGSIVGLGKSDTLRAFVQGGSDGRLPAGIASALAQRSQMWLYFPVPEKVIQDLSAGGGVAQDNPMMAGVSKGLEKVREFCLGASFGSSAIGLEVTLGCTDAAAASELQQGLQQFIGMMQLMAAQNSSAPRLLSRLKAASAGNAFRLTTEVTMQDVELAIKSSGITPAPRAAGPTAGSSGQAPEGSSAVPARSAPPATVEYLELLPGDEQQLRYTRLRIDNQSAQPVKEIRVTFNYLDRTGRTIGKWTRRHQDPVAAYLAPAQSSREVRCPTFHVPSTTARVTMTVHEIVFADGTKWLSGQ